MGASARSPSFADSAGCRRRPLYSAPMREVQGKTILDTLEEVVEPSHSAVLVIDMQNRSCLPEGRLANAGVDISMMREILPPMVNFLDAARAYDVPIIFLQALTGPNLMSHSAPFLKFASHVLGVTPDWPDESWEGELLAELKRRPDEPVVVKYRSSAFVNTNLDSILRAIGTKTTIVVGQQTPGCVEASVRSAADHDYYPVVVTDCVGSLRRDLHEASMKVMTARWDSATSQEIVDVWTRFR